MTPHMAGFYRFVSILDLIFEGFWTLNRPQDSFLEVFGPNIVPKILTNTIFNSFSNYYMEDKKIHDVIRTYTDINAYTHLYTRIYVYTCIYTHIYAYLKRKKKIHDMNISSLGPPRWSAKRHNARGSPTSPRVKRKCNMRSSPVRVGALLLKVGFAYPVDGWILFAFGVVFSTFSDLFSDF